MMCVSLLTLLGLSWVLLPCDGQISVTSDKKTYYVLTGEDVEIIWKISGIKASNLKLREWMFRTANTILALINDDDKLIVNNGSILDQGFEVRKPSTLYLKNVDRRFDGKYRFTIRKNFDSPRSEVTVIVLTTPMIQINCSTPTTVNQSDYCACECKGSGGIPPADVTWYKDNKQIVTGKEEAILVFNNVDKDDSGTYKCEAKNSIEKAKNETSIELIVNYPPENVRLILIRSSQSATITCAAEARPEPSFKIFFNCEMNMVQSNKTYTIAKVNRSYVGLYKCVAENILGSALSDPEYLCLGPPTTAFPSISSQTTAKYNETGNGYKNS